MKKILLNELDTEKRNYYIKLNKKLINQLQSDLYESQMEWQYYESKDIMNDDALRAIEYHDHYTSFYYILRDWRKFIININPEYLDDDIKKTYNTIISKIDILDSMNLYSKNYNNLNEWLHEQTKKVLQSIEDYLHTYEEYPNEDDAIQYADEMDQLDSYYLEFQDDNQTDGVIRLDVNYTECFI